MSSMLPLLVRLFTCLCIKCAHLLLTPDQIQDRQHPVDMVHSSPKVAILAMYKLAKKNRVCPHCTAHQPEWILQEKMLLRPMWSGDGVIPYIGPHHLYNMLQNVPEQHMRLCGFRLPHAHMGSIIHFVFLVSPNLIRPTRSIQHENDLTVRTRNIIRTNRIYKNDNPNLSLRSTGEEVVPTPDNWKFRHLRDKKVIIPAHLESYFELQRQCVGLQDARAITKNDLDYGRELQSIRTRFSSSRNKRGRMRANLLGKRGNFTARGVASPSTHINPDHARDCPTLVQ